MNQKTTDEGLKMTRFAYYGIEDERTAYDTLLEISYGLKDDQPIARDLKILLASPWLELLTYDDFVDALRQPLDHRNPLFPVTHFAQRRFERVRDYFLRDGGSNGNSKTNSNHTHSRHRHRPTSRAGRGLADEAG